MNFIIYEDDSVRETSHFQFSVSIKGPLIIPLKRTILHEKNEYDEIVGFIRDKKSEKKTFYHPSGSSSTYEVVTHWIILPYQNMKEYNSNVPIDEKKHLLISLPYNIIDRKRIKAA